MINGRTLTAGVIAIAVALCVAISVRSRRHLKVGGQLKDIEWVIVDCHETSVAFPWAAKITPDRHPELVRELMGAIRKAKRGPATKSEGDCFVIFKMKGGGVQGFNFVAWEGEPEIEIKPGYFSSSLPKLLRRIEDRKIGWQADDSIADIRVREIELREDGEPLASFGPDSPRFARLASAALEVIKTVDPRICTQDLPEADPTKSLESGGKVQFIISLQEPVRVNKLIVQCEVGTEVANIRYVTFPSGVVAIIMGLSSGDQPSWPCSISFLDAQHEGQWHGWGLWELVPAAETMRRPDPQEAFARLLQVYNEQVSRGRSSRPD